MVEMYYPDLDEDDPLANTDIEVHTNIIIKGTGTTKDSI